MMAMTMRQLGFCVALAAVVMVAVSWGAPNRGLAGTAEPSVDLAYEHLVRVMDRFHLTTDVYTDVGAGGNHFFARCRMGSGATLDDVGSADARSGASALVGTFTPGIPNWGGWYLQNGMLVEGENEAQCNWGDVPDAGLDLRGATELSWWARGAEGGERVEFFAFGVGWDPDFGVRIEPFPDSSAKTTTCGLQVSSCFVTLKDTWQQYTIDLSGLDLSYVLGGFGWISHGPENDGASITFYMDDIVFDKPRPDEPRFLCSYETLPPSAHDFDLVLRNVGFTYDNALALLAFLPRGTGDDMERAGLLADALAYAAEHDRYYDDSRLRNAYQCGDLAVPPGWITNGRFDAARLPGWWDPEEQMWLEDRFQVGSLVGNMAWPMIALLSYIDESADEEHLATVLSMGEWIESCCRDVDGGYTGGFEGWEPTPTQVTWKATEHNIDLYVAFSKLYAATGDLVWLDRAEHARLFVEGMWAGDHFWTGTDSDGQLNESVLPADINTWAVLALGEDYTTSLTWVEDNCSLSEGNFVGSDFDCDPNNSNPEEPDCIWWEGTAHLALALQVAERTDDSQIYLDALRKAQIAGLNADGWGIPAASCDGLSTGFDWEYFARVHVGATAWYLLAELGYNPLAVAPATPTPTATATATATATPSPSPTATETPVPPTSTLVPSATATYTPSDTPVPSGTPTLEQPCGDVNDDGSVTSIDALLLLQFVVSLLNSVPNPDGADVNSDGQINSLDALLILQVDAGLLDMLDCP